MGHYCAAPNESKSGLCGRWLVNYEHCHDHRLGTSGWDASPPAPVSVEVSSGGSGWQNHRAELLADVLTDGVDKAIAKRVVDYLGSFGKIQLRAQRWDGKACEELAQTAREVLALKKKVHDRAGKVFSSAALPPDTPRFHRKLTEKIAAEIPLPGDSELEAIARGLQIVGIFECVIKQLPITSCACLRMLGGQMAQDEGKERVEELIRETREDLVGHRR